MENVKRFALPTLSTLFGAIGLLYCFRGENISWVFFLCTLIMLANGITQLIRREDTPSGPRSLSVRTEEGESTISVDALQNILRDELRKASDIHDAKVILSLDAEGNSLSCRLRFKLDSQDNIPGRTDSHKRTVRDAFERLLPGSPAFNISCQVDDIVTRSTSSSDNAKSSPDNTFSGPIYPVYSDDEN